jgi:hypothetical protein
VTGDVNGEVGSSIITAQSDGCHAGFWCDWMVRCATTRCRLRWLTRPTFLRAATDPDVDETERHALTVKEVEMIIPARGDADPWRATARVWTAITHLTARRRDARIYGVPIRDTYYNMLRLI